MFRSCLRPRRNAAPWLRKGQAPKAHIKSYRINDLTGDGISVNCSCDPGGRKDGVLYDVE